MTVPAGAPDSGWREKDLWSLLIVPATLVYSGIYVLVVLLPDAWTSWVPGGFYDFAMWPVTLLAAVGAWRAALRSPRGSSIRAAWWTVMAAFWSWVVGTVMWTALDYPEISLADIGFVAFYPLIIAGLLAFPTRGGRVGRRPEFWIDVATIAIGGFMLVWHFALGEMVRQHHPHVLGAVVNLAYPILSLILLLGTVTVWLRDPSASVRPAVRWLTVGALAFCGADIVYAAQSLSDSYAPGGLADVGWFLATVAFVLASVGPGRRDAHGSPDEVERPYFQRYTPYIASTSGFAVLLYATAARSEGGTAVFIVCGTVLTILVLIRQIRTVREFGELKAEQAASAVSARTESRFRALVQNSSDVIVVVDRKGRIQFSSPPIERDFGYSPEQMAGSSLEMWIHPEDVAEVAGTLAAATPDPGSAQPHRYRVRRADGEWRRVESRATDMSHEESIAGIVLNLRDVTEREALEAHLTHRAFHDPLTGLANRALFRDRLQHALERETRSPTGIAVFFLDLDDFKEVNDTYGHAVGDLLLCHVTDRLLNATRGCDTVARLGGDEFAVLQEGVRTEAETVPLARRILDSVCHPVALDGHEVQVRLSIGIAIANGNASVDEVLRNADLAMYKVKKSKDEPAAWKRGDEPGEPGPESAAESGGGPPGVHDPESAAENDHDRIWDLEPGAPAAPATSAAPARVTTEGDLEPDGFVRWSSPDGRPAPPAAFLRIDDSTGLVMQLDRIGAAGTDRRKP